MTSEVLTSDRVRIHAGSATRDEAIREAADLLVAAGAVTSAYYDAMLAREQTVSTYMGNELAIPHGTHQGQQGRVAGAHMSEGRYRFGIGREGRDCPRRFEFSHSRGRGGTQDCVVPHQRR